MLPGGALSTEPYAAHFLPPRDRFRERLVDYDYGGAGLQDPSEGLRVKVWRCRYIDGDFVLDAPGVPATVVYSEPGVEEIGLTFDQNMQPFLCWKRADGSAAFRWFDPTLAAFDVVELPAGTTSPRCVLDDKRHVSGTIAGASDIILAYIRGDALYYRQQRDRFLIEYELANGLHGAELDQIGMNTQNRLQFRLLGGPTSQHAPVSLERIVRNLAARCGVVDVDARDLTEVYVDGYQITALTTGRAAIEPLRMVGAFDLVERGTTLRFPTRGKAPVATLTADELGVRSLDTDPGPAITTRKAQDVELPRQIRLRYPSLSRDYEIGEQLSPARMGTVGVNDVSVDCPVVMTDSTAAQIAERLFREAWASRHAHSFTVGAQHHALEPADVILVPVDGRLQRMRIVSINDSGLIVRTAEAVRDDDGAYVSIAIATQPPRPPSIISMLGETDYEFLDLPALREEDDTAGFYFAAWRTGLGNEWNGATLYRSTDGGITWSPLLTVGNQAIVGEVIAAPDGGDGYTWDNTRAYVVKLETGELESRTDAAVLSGANAAAIGAPGRWQIVQFANAELIGPNTYRLTRLIQGARGTEHLIGTTQVGDRFVLVSGPGIVRVGLQSSEIGAEHTYRVVSVGASFSSAVNEAFTGKGQALKCFSPVYIRGERDGSGNLTITAIRRDRLSDTLRDGVETPLSEAAEAYEVDVLDGPGGNVVRTISGLTTPSAVYSAADQTTDFGAPQAQVTVRFYQLSAQVGRGTPGEATV